MALLQEIQAALLESRSDLAPVLLKLRLLAAELGSAELDDWVRHEAEGYPPGVEVPSYRKLEASYSGTFIGPYGTGYETAPIPPSLIEKHAGAQWTKVDMRQSIAAVDDLTRAKGGVLAVPSQNLILILGDKIYKGLNCAAVRGTVSTTAVREIQNAVRHRILELTVQMKKAVPAIADVSLGSAPAAAASAGPTVTNIVNQTVFGNYSGVTSSGHRTQIALAIVQGNRQSVEDALAKAGLPEAAAAEFAGVLASEKPEGNGEPFGKRAQAWLLKNLKDAGSGAWKIGLTVATQVLTDAAKRYYGL